MNFNPYCQALNELKSRKAHELKEVGDQWRTPNDLWWGINTKFGPFTLDLFADDQNAKCDAYYTAEDNALTQDWSVKLTELGGAGFGNPPYSRAQQHDNQYITGMTHIIAHTLAMRERGGRYVFLIKVATSETWWPENADHIAFIRGRIGFDLPDWFVPADEKQKPSGAFFAGAIAIFDKSWTGPATSYINREYLEKTGQILIAQIHREAEKLSSIPVLLHSNNKVWPREVNLILDQITEADHIAEHLKNKLRNHINILKIEGYSINYVIGAARSLAQAMGTAA